MPKYNVTVVATYAVIVEAKTAEEARDEARKELKKAEKPDSLYYKVKRNREEEPVLSHRQKKKLKAEESENKQEE